MDVSEAKRLKGLEDENARLKRLLPDAMLDNAALTDLLGKSGDACRKAASGRASGGWPRDERTVDKGRGQRERSTAARAEVLDEIERFYKPHRR